MGVWGGESFRVGWGFGSFCFGSGWATHQVFLLLTIDVVSRVWSAKRVSRGNFSFSSLKSYLVMLGTQQVTEVARQGTVGARVELKYHKGFFVH